MLHVWQILRSGASAQPDGSAGLASGGFLGRMPGSVSAALHNKNMVVPYSAASVVRSATNALGEPRGPSRSSRDRIVAKNTMSAGIVVMPFVARKPPMSGPTTKKHRRGPRNVSPANVSRGSAGAPAGNASHDQPRSSKPRVSSQPNRPSHQTHSHAACRLYAVRMRACPSGFDWIDATHRESGDGSWRTAICCRRTYHGPVGARRNCSGDVVMSSSSSSSSPMADIIPRRHNDLVARSDYDAASEN
mmetsp:Transcript_25519/g.101709  ORF Transcript_25519/g.101709 Transcript_25519/m.101709 type:complete len:247 (-) Transcript_25519:230-970(-)